MRATTSIEKYLVSTEGVEFATCYDAVLATSSTPVTCQEVSTSFGRTHVIVAGLDNRPSVVLLPGGSATSTVWMSLLPALTHAHRVLAVDLLGDVGLSVPTGEGPRREQDLWAWLDELLDGLDSPTLMGHSYGAQLALGYALARPGAARELVLLEPTTVFSRFRTSYLAHAIPSLVRPTGPRQERLLRWETRGAPLPDAWRRLVLQAADTFPSRRPVVPARPDPAAVAALTCPVSVVVAGRSRAVDPKALALSARAAGARVVSVGEASHYTLPLIPTAELCSVIAAV
jgi:pimeloyl-ACP methyl ester carboxylesterase